MNKKVQDRGMKKWTAMMLPEHMALLKEWREEDKRDLQPILTSWQLDSLQEKLEIAYRDQISVEITKWHDNEKVLLNGYLTNIYPHLQQIEMTTETGVQKISISSVFQIDIL